MSSVVWNAETNPIIELDSYKRAFEDDWGSRVFTLERFELRCSREFMEWMMGLRSMQPLVRMLIDEAQRRSTYVSPWRWFYMLDNVRVSTRDDVDAGEAKFLAVMQGDYVEALLTITAMGAIPEPAPVTAAESHDYRVDYAADGRAKAEGFGPKMRVVPENTGRFFRTSYGPYAELKASDVDPATHPEIHAAIVKRDAEAARDKLLETFFAAIDDAMLYGAKLDSCEFDFDAFTASLQRRGYLIQENPHG